MTFGEYLKQTRNRFGWTQPDAATAIGIEQSYLSKLESGKAYPSDAVFQRLLNAYKLETSDILKSVSLDMTDRLRDIDSVRTALQSQAGRHVGLSRAWLVGGVVCLALGGACFGLSRLDSDRTAMRYSYQSTGVLLPGEPLDTFASVHDIDPAHTQGSADAPTQPMPKA